MAEKPHEIIQRILEKSSQLAVRYASVCKEKNEAFVKIAELESTIAQLRKEIDRLQQVNQYLKVVAITDPKREDVEESRAVLTDLVREIDKCILELSEE